MPPGNPTVTLEDIILTLPPSHREVIADLRGRQYESARRVDELESELTFAKQRVVELENELAAAVSNPPQVPAPQSNLQELIAQLKAQHQAEVETVRRQTTEKMHSLDDPSFDAEGSLASSTSRSLKPLPKNFEFVDLMQLREGFTAEGFAPSSPLQQPLISEFINHIDGVRQCTKDGRFAQLYYDPVKADLLRRMFDMCKSVEAKMGSTAYLTLPSQAVPAEPVPKEAAESDVVSHRRKEVSMHMAAVESCGEVFNRAVKDVAQLEELSQNAAVLPHFLTEFDLVCSAMSNDSENLQRNEVVLVEAGSLHVENINSHRKQLIEQADRQAGDIEKRERDIDKLFHEMLRLLAQAEEGFREVMTVVQSHSKTQIEVAMCDFRANEVRKVVEAEVLKQQRYLEGAKFTTFLCTKARDLYRRLHNNLEESVRSRRELCERIKTTSQEQLYTMAEVLHDVLIKRQNADTAQLRNDQAALEAANRALMGLVHQPNEMDRQMATIRELTLSISNAKSRLSQSSHEFGSIRQVLNKYQTLAFLKRDTNFLSIHDNLEKTSRLKEKLDDAVLRIKYVSEVLVEVSDPDTRQDYVVQQCLEALKVSVGDVSELLASRAVMEDFEEAYRSSTATKLKRHKRLVSHFLEEIKDGTNDLASVEPAIELNVVNLVEGMESIVAALTHNEEPTALSAGRGIPGVGSGAMGTFGTGGTQSRHANPNASMGGPGGAPGEEYVPDTVELEQMAHHTFARSSSKLKTSHDMHKLVKPNNGGMEMSNTSALGAIGFRLGSGVHAFAVRIGSNCSRLLVGFADWNLPLDGYCNSLKYSGCYYLHLGNGTLWAPDQRVERKPYTYEAIGTTVDGVLRCIVDTNHRTIGYVWNDVNLGIAFRNVNLTRTLYPAFEVFSNGTAVEFVNTNARVDDGDQHNERDERRR